MWKLSRVLLVVAAIPAVFANACSKTDSVPVPVANPTSTTPSLADAATVPTVDDLGPKLEAIRSAAGIPALAAAAYRGGRLLGRGAVGARRLGGEEPVTASDVWHLGSDTKAMTATLAAMFVEEGKLDWQRPLGELLPDVPMDPEFASVPFEALLFHRSGLPANLPTGWASSARAATDLPAARKDAVVQLLLAKPSQPVGTFLYSNSGYVVAGAILESLAKDSWENLVRKRIFDKLGMASCGFGPPATKGMVDQPWGHSGKKGAYVPIAPGPNADNPLALGPAGTVHCALDDWAKFAHEHARGAKGANGIVSAKSFAKLQTPPRGGDYAMGWGVVSRDWGGGVVLSHSGSNTMFYATVWVAPEKDLVLLAATNAADDVAATAVDSAFAPMIEAYSK